MYLDFINVNDLKKFAEAEFGQITTFSKFKNTKGGDAFYNMTFRLKPNGAYEEAYFFDFEVFPIRVEDMEDRRCAKINERFVQFMKKSLPNNLKPLYNAACDKQIAKKQKNSIIF